MTMKLGATLSLITSLGLALLPVGCALEGAEDDADLDQIEAQGYAGDPVIFVHGCTPPGFSDADSAHDFDNMVAYFAAHGVPSDHLILFVNQEEQCTSIARFAAQLDALINRTLQRTHKSKVDIVGMSMGAVAARYYFNTVGTDKVRDFASIAGVQHGTNGGLFAPDGLYWQDYFGGYPWFEGIHELYPPYACQGQAYGASGGPGSPTADIQFLVNGCLTSTGRTVYKDETPGSIRYVAVRNSRDDIVVPSQSSCLDMNYLNDCSSSINKTVADGPAECFPGYTCPAHLMTLYDPNVIARTYNFLQGGSW